ncbi:aryl-sulfate sulfotransferase [Winogradskyella sp. 3972H.M.0a.05]|uniref:aryl-sulfate sulfotransferase n=1 Tax=Winogradskyella sp. 3972H.M.0a.05 TaxID=2950277 RepID=UPI003392E514
MMRYRYTYLAVLMILLFSGCQSDDDTTSPPPTPDLTENIDVYNASLVENNLVLAIENGGEVSYLLDKAGNRVKEWNFDSRLGNDLELMDDGRLIGMFKAEGPDFSFGGFGGLLKILDSDGNTEWEYTYSNANELAHHDVEMLPNGNVLFIAWERIGSIAAAGEGVNSTVDIFPEVLLEINPSNNEIVWQWHSMDHIVQDMFPTANNFGDVSDNPQLIDINYNIVENGDIMHANGIDYDPINDLIYFSINGYSEVWVIDHSTTTEEAATSSGGNFNKGGDLVYRFGNPEAYDNVGTRLFYNNHFPNLLEGNEPGAGNILVYNNGNDVEQSTVYELDLPEPLSLTANANNEPAIVWSFTDPDLFFGRISGAVRLPGGNTLIAEGDFGLWEVTPQGQVAWKYNGLGTSFWRCYGYSLDSEAISNVGL